MFEISKRDGLARLGRIKTKHGVLDTPTLLPVINPKILTLSMKELKECGAQGIITNSYIIYKNTYRNEMTNKPANLYVCITVNTELYVRGCSKITSLLYGR